MDHDAQHIERLIRELSALTPSERARVVEEAARTRQPSPSVRKFSRPVLSGGTAWIGGDLSREEMYDDDGR
jgi:hypothetical protein